MPRKSLQPPSTNQLRQELQELILRDLLGPANECIYGWSDLELAHGFYKTVAEVNTRKVGERAGGKRNTEGGEKKERRRANE